MIRDELETEIINTLAPYRERLPFEEIKAQITIILNDYDVACRKTELVVREEDKNNKMILMFIASKAAGGNIIALAEAMKEKGVNYQKKLMAICQDIDIKAVYMAYVQLSLYGVPAVVYQSDTLRDPNGLESSTGYLYTFGYVMQPKLQDEWRKINEQFKRPQ